MQISFNYFYTLLIVCYYYYFFFFCWTLFHLLQKKLNFWARIIIFQINCLSYNFFLIDIMKFIKLNIVLAICFTLYLWELPIATVQEFHMSRLIRENWGLAFRYYIYGKRYIDWLVGCNSFKKIQFVIWRVSQTEMIKNIIKKIKF